MLRKLPARQNEGEPRREWFTDEYFDLYVWHQPDGTLHGFQLCYDKAGDERALTWNIAGDFHHQRVDAGESSPLDLRSPILTRPCPFQLEPMQTEFARRSLRLESALRGLILQKLAEFPETD